MATYPLDILLGHSGPLGHVFDAIPDGIVVADESGRIQLVNRQAEVMFGYRREDLANHPVEVLMPERLRSVHPGHRARYLANPHVRPMGTGLHLLGLRRDGTEFPVEISLSPLSVSGTPFVLATIRDVTEQRRLEGVARAELEGRLTLLQAILDELPVGAYLVRGNDARLVLANRRVAELWGAEWPEGQPMAAFLAASGTRVYDPAGRELAVEQLGTLRALRSGQPVRQMHEVLRRGDGRTLPIQVDAVALDPQVFPYLSEVGARPTDPVPVALVVHEDVSALKEAEQLKDEFIALAAHELRNPVASLSGYAQMLAPRTSRREPQATRTADQPGGANKKRHKGRAATPPMPESWRVEAVEAVAEAARRLTALTDDLLDATRLHANRLDLRQEPTELGALVRRVVRRLQVTTTTERHPMRVTVPDEPVVVIVDAHRVEQVLTNLLTNSIKYSPQGGAVEIGVTVAEPVDPKETVAQALSQGQEQGQGMAVPHPAGDLDIDADASALAISAATGVARVARVARVTVRDHGMGIPIEQQTYIFGRFARAENARQAAIPGTGLGLYLCRELLERQDGRIWFASVEGRGTTFTFEVPILANAPEDDVQDDAGDAQESVGQ